MAGGFLTISTTWEARVVGAGVVRRGRRTSPDGKGFTELESRYFVFFVCLLLFLMWIIFKVFTEVVTYCFWFFLFLLLLFYGFGVFLVGGGAGGWEAHGISSSPPGFKPALPALEGEVSTTGPPGKSHRRLFLMVRKHYCQSTPYSFQRGKSWQIIWSHWRLLSRKVIVPQQALFCMFYIL